MRITVNHAAYADDLKLFGKSLVDSSNLQNAVNFVFKWSEEWQLPLNLEKCSVLYLGSKNPKVNYVIGGKILNQVLSQNDLGVIVDHRLTWTLQKRHTAYFTC